MSKLKVIVLVICHADEKKEYLNLGKSIKETWGKTETSQVKIWYGWGNGYEGKDYNDFILDAEESTGAILLKTLAFFEFIKKEKFDYIFRVNAGSYVDTKAIIKHLEDKPREKFYCGTRGNYFDKQDIQFASGSGFFLSRDLVMHSIENKDDFGIDHIDDVSYGRFMAKHNIPLSDESLRITWTGSGYIHQIGKEVVNEKNFPIESNYHWRLRSEDGSRELDCEKMRELYKQLNS